jgi:hypothetical protein
MNVKETLSISLYKKAGNLTEEQICDEITADLVMICYNSNYHTRQMLP